MKKHVLIGFLALSLVLASCDAPKEVPKDTGKSLEELPADRERKEENFEKEAEEKLPQGPEKGKTAPEFKLEDQNGEIKSNQDFQDKILVLDFFTTGCPYCVAELPDLAKHQETYQDNIQIVLVNIGQDPAKVKDFLAKKDIDLPILFDQTGEVAMAYQAYATPSHAFVDKDGVFLGNVVGKLPEEKIVEIFNELTSPSQGEDQD